MLAKICFVALCVVMAVAADEQEGVQRQPTARLFALQATSTKIKIETVVVTSTVKSLCASLVNVTGACRRRRRGVEERPIVLSFDDDDNIDIYNPSPIQPVETTLAPELAQVAHSDLLRSSYEPVEVDIIGLAPGCEPRRFGPLIGGLVSNLQNAINSVTLLFTNKLTATLTVFKTVTSGSKPFVVQGCTPNPFAYQTC